MAEDFKDSSYYQDWKTVLVPRLQKNQSWADFFDAVSDVFAKNIYGPIQDLKRIRDPRYQDRETNIEQAKFLGFDYNSALFTDVEYENLVTFLNMYNTSVKGIEGFINFLGWVKNAKFQVYQLWAKGKRNYSDDPLDIDPFERETPYIRNNSKIDGTGTKEWYPTSHVDLSYDGGLYDIDESDVWYLFYKCAPIQLVLRSLAAVFTAPTLPLYIRTSASGYSNAHICIPCIYTYDMPMIFASYQRVISSSKTNFFGYGYDTSGVPTYQSIVFFDKQMTSEEVKNKGLVVTRTGIATNINQGSYYYSDSPINTIRMDYYPESSQNHWKGKGLLIEPDSVNYLLDSSNPINRIVQISKGTYTFTGYEGTYTLSNASTGSQIGTVTNGYLTFSIEDDSNIQVICNSKNRLSYYQLEKGSLPTSYIPTNSLERSGRGTEVAKFENLYRRIGSNNEATYYVDFSDLKMNPDCVLLFIYEGVGSFIRLERKESKMILSIYKENQFLNSIELAYNRKIRLSLSKQGIIFNNNQYTYPLANGVIPKILYLGQENGNRNINGYIESFRFYPVFPN